jgi:hypothetical protein
MQKNLIYSKNLQGMVTVKNKIFLFLAGCLSLQTAIAQSIPQGVYTELAKYPDLTQDYVQKLPSYIVQVLSENEKHYTSEIKSVCESDFNVKYMPTITGSKNSTIHDFESGFISVEATFCFQNTTPQKVITLYSSPEFQKSSVSTIRDSYRKGNLVCEKTTAPTIGNSHYCYNQEILSQQGYVLGYSLNVWNDTIENADAPVYFRAVVVSATQVQNTTQFHLQTLVRGPKLSFIQKIFAKGAIESEQKSVYEKMKQRLQ